MALSTEYTHLKYLFYSDWDHQTAGKSEHIYFHDHCQYVRPSPMPLPVLWKGPAVVVGLYNQLMTLLCPLAFCPISRSPWVNNSLDTTLELSFKWQLSCNLVQVSITTTNNNYISYLFPLPSSYITAPSQLSLFSLHLQVVAGCLCYWSHYRNISQHKGC